MTIRFYKGDVLTPADIDVFETTIGHGLPASYREFIMQHNGAEPETNIFHVGEGNDSGVNRLIPLKQILEELEAIDHVPSGYIPIAWAEGGNYICMDMASGKVYFWDHELPSADLRLANSFDEFLEMLQPFDVNNIKLKPGQIKEAWIDPDFLKGS